MYLLVLLIHFYCICSELAFILIRHAKDITSPLTEEIPRPSYSGDKGHHKDEKTTTLFRELVSRMPGNCYMCILFNTRPVEPHIMIFLECESLVLFRIIRRKNLMLLCCAHPEVAKEALERCISLGDNHEVEFDYTFIQSSKTHDM